MKVFLSAAAASAALLMTAGAANASLLYQLDVTTSYQFGAPSGALGYVGEPDTGFATFTNTGPSVFVGTISDVAVSPGAGDQSQSFNVTLNTGDSLTFGVGSESSNQGGYGPNGIQLLINGLFGATAANLSVFDGDIHSGTTNGGGVTDAYVLQGGCPVGCDYGDDIETSQAAGHFRFALNGPDGVPEPASWAMMLTGFFGMGAAMRNARKAKTATA